MGRVILVRHAESEANRDGRFLGVADPPLTPLGMRQVGAVAEALQGEVVGRALSSPLQRARTTAEAIATRHGVAVEVTGALAEMDIGEMEGLKAEEARERFGEFLRRWRGEEAAGLPMPGGESLQDVQERAWSVVEPLLDEGSGAAVVVTHNFVIRALLCRALEIDLNQFRRFAVDLASRSVLEASDGRITLAALNDGCHLPPDEAPAGSG